MAAGEQVARLEGHEDYVRCGAAHPGQPDTLATGGYDHALRLWDARSGEARGPSPVHSALYHSVGWCLTLQRGHGPCNSVGHIL